MEDVYYTIEKESQGYFKDKGSKFYGYAFPVKTEDDIKGAIELLKKKHHEYPLHDIKIARPLTVVARSLCWNFFPFP